MAENPLRVTAEYVRNFVALWGMAIGWTPEARAQLRDLGLISPDILHVLKSPTVTSCEKETAHGAITVVEGVTADDVKLRITIWLEVGEQLLKVINIEKF